MKYNDTIAIRNSLSAICCKQDIKILKPMPQLQIRCGLNGGLPFENLITDCYSGCLNLVMYVMETALQLYFG